MRRFKAALAGLDPASPLLRLANVVITPHIAAYSDDYLESCWRRSVEAVLAPAGGYWPPSYVSRPGKPRWELRVTDMGERLPHYFPGGP